MRLLALLLLLSPLLPAQGEVTELAVKQQAQFIEAKREALLGKTEEAIALFRTLLEAELKNDAILFELARLEYAAGNSSAAITALRQAYAARPNDVYAAFLAELYQASGRYREGAELYADLIAQNPAAAENYLERAAFQVRDQDIKGAIKTYEELEARSGINAEVSRRKHALYLGTGDQKRAERELVALVEAFPQQISYRHLLAGYYSSQGEDKEARRVYQDILAIEPADVRAQLAIQDATSEPSNTAGGTDDSELLALLARTDVDLDLKIGKLLPMIQQVASTNDRALADRLLALATELRRVHPDAAKAAAIAGDLYYHSGRLAEAAAAYEETLKLDDTVYPVWEQLLATLYLNNQSVALREYAEEALDVFPNRPSVYVHYALGEVFRGDFEEAESLLQQAQLMVSASPESTAALEEFAQAIKQLADGTGGKVDADLLPGGPTAPLAFYLSQRADPAVSALSAADHAENTNALLLELMGDAQSSAGNKAAAADLYQRAKAAGSKSATLAQKIAQL